MAVLAAAQLLDELMGRNRNNLPNEKQKEMNWEDPEVSGKMQYYQHTGYSNLNAQFLMHALFSKVGRKYHHCC